MTVEVKDTVVVLNVALFTEVEVLESAGPCSRAGKWSSQSRAHIRRLSCSRAGRQ